MCQVGRLRRSVSKQYFICALTFFLFATYNQNGLFCNAIPPVSSSKDASTSIEDILYDSDVIADTQDIIEDKTDLKEDVDSKLSYMDFRSKFNSKSYNPNSNTLLPCNGPIDIGFDFSFKSYSAYCGLSSSLG